MGGQYGPPPTLVGLNNHRLDGTNNMFLLDSIHDVEPTYWNRLNNRLNVVACCWKLLDAVGSVSNCPKSNDQRIGTNLLEPFKQHVGCCWMLLEAVGTCWMKFDFNQTFVPKHPTILLFYKY